ncbi:MAG: class I SAM-dependent methyltransferase [Planctomycetes bacterium]|nr:class I SAM-dependent methyltransferase [Planctomycetota bacterium]
MSGKTIPCPYRFAWALDLPFRRWAYRFVLDRLRLRSGMIALEVGAGTGAFTLPAARRVAPTGKVIAIDVQPEMIMQIEQRVEHAGITNVETYVAGAYELPLEDGSVDCAFFIAVLGEIADPHRALNEAFRVLKSGGVLSITEDFSDPDYYCPGEIVRLVEGVGFETSERFGGFWLHTLNARKTDPEPHTQIL